MSDAEASGSADEGIDVDGVEGWFSANVPGVELPLTFDRIAGGRSNLTYRVADSGGRAWALRRPPLRMRLASAHDMGREHKIISALQDTAVPVPPIAGLCEDDEVNGAPFYVMEFVEGTVVRSKAEGEPLSEEERSAVGRSVVETMVEIHAIDPDDIGIGDLGKKEDYVARQLHRWQGQWEKGKTREVPLIEEVHDRLAERIPEQGPATIVHGDYRLDNMIMRPASAGGYEIAAVLDWELCTLGDPLADLGMLLTYWAEEGDRLIPLFEPATMLHGFQSRDDVRRIYGELSGRDLSEIAYYEALALWKLGIILEGIISRSAAGGYGDGEDAADTFGAVVSKLAEAASEAVDSLS